MRRATQRPPALRRLALGLTAVAIVLIGGTIGFMVVEGIGPLDAFYTTVGLMSTVGDVIYPLSPSGRSLAIVIIIVGICSLFYTLGALAEYLIGGQFGRALARSRMDRKIERQQGHAIICGYGRVGRRIAQEFAEVRQPFVVVDPQEANATLLETAGYLYILGDAAEDAVLLQAGIRQARTLLAATDVDAENIAITLSARALAPKLWIVGRANHDETEAKLRRAGADRVLSPYMLGGHRMASLARRPHLVDFLDTVMQGGDLDLALEEVVVEPHSPLIGVALPASQGNLPSRWRDHTVIAIRPTGASQWIAAGWRGGAPIVVGDHLIVLGPAENRRAKRGQMQPASTEHPGEEQAWRTDESDEVT
jgi:voltage-gated potassium channel